MSKLPTVEIVNPAGPLARAKTIWINESDYDPDKHTLVKADEPEPEPETATAPAKPARKRSAKTAAKKTA